jgi:CheY-like chemotaxis protein
MQITAETYKPDHAFLVVEDTPFDEMKIRRSLERAYEGKAVIWLAKNAQQAINTIRNARGQNVPLTILLDYKLPGDCGDVVLEEMEERGQAGYTILTGMWNERDYHRADATMQKGECAGRLRDVYDPNQLKATIRNLPGHPLMVQSRVSEEAYTSNARV